MKTIEYDPNSYNTALDELVIALKTGGEITTFNEFVIALRSGEEIRVVPHVKPDTVKMWQWVYRSQLGHIRSTSEFFRSQEEAAELYPYVTLLQRADWTEISVEVEQ